MTTSATTTTNFDEAILSMSASLDRCTSEATLPQDMLAWIVHVVLPRLRDSGSYVVGEEVSELIAEGFIGSDSNLGRTFNDASATAIAGDKAETHKSRIDPDNRSKTPAADALMTFREMGGCTTTTRVSLMVEGIRFARAEEAVA